MPHLLPQGCLMRTCPPVHLLQGHPLPFGLGLLLGQPPEGGSHCFVAPPSTHVVACGQVLGQPHALHHRLQLGLECLVVSDVAIVGLEAFINPVCSGGLPTRAGKLESQQPPDQPCEPALCFSNNTCRFPHVRSSHVAVTHVATLFMAALGWLYSAHGHLQVL